MSLLRQIKAAQIEAANINKEDQPEQDQAETPPETAPVSNKRMGKMQRIKAQQIIDAEKNGEANPYHAATPPAEKTANKALGDLKHYQTALYVDIRKISNQKSLLDKAKVKQSVLPIYLPFVDEYVLNAENYPNTVAVQCMIWLLDVGEIEHGLNLALHLIQQGQKMPERIKRDMPTFLIDTLYDWANVMLKDDHGASPYFDVMVATAEKNAWDVHPLCMSKSYAMLAKHHVRNGEYETAYALCLKAKKVNPEKHGVKLLTEEIEKHLAKK